MSQFHEKAFQDYVMATWDIAGIRFEASPRYNEHRRLYDANRDKLLTLIPEKDQELAQHCLEEIAYGENIELDHYYKQGMMDGIRTLKLLGVL